jgi:hypothetical protein
MEIQNNAPEKADVRLPYERTLPRVCARCGAPATMRDKYPIVEQPSKAEKRASKLRAGLKTILFVVTGINPHISGEAKGTISNPYIVWLPFCEKHKKFRGLRTDRRVFIPICLLIAILLPLIGIAAAVKACSTDGGLSAMLPTLEKYMPALGLIFLIWLLSCIALHFLWKQARAEAGWIEPLEVGRSYMILGGVAHEFAAAVEAVDQKESDRVEEFLDGIGGPPA